MEIKEGMGMMGLLSCEMGQMTSFYTAISKFSHTETALLSTLFSAE